MTLLTQVRHVLSRKVKIKLVFIIIGVIIGAQIETLTLSIIQPFIMIITDPEVIYTNSLLNFVYNLLGFQGANAFLAALALAVAGIYAFRGFYVYFLTRIKSKFLATSSMELSNRLLLQTLKQPYLYHVNHNAVKLQKKVIKDSERFTSVINSVILLLIDGFMALFMLIFLIFTSVSMSMVVLFFASVCIFVYFKFFKSRINSSGDDEAKGVVQINKSVLQALYGAKEIKISRKESFFTDKFNSVGKNTVVFKTQLQSILQLPKLFIESLCFSGAFVVVAAVVIMGVDLEALIPQLGVFLLAAFKILPAISRIVTNITNFTRHKTAIGLVYSGLYEPSAEYTPFLPEPEVETISKDIIIKNLTFMYPKTKKPILKNVSLTIPHNKSVAFVGTSGAGKTTLVDIILGILHPKQGSVVYNGKSIHHHFSFWAKNIGYIPQVIYLLDENILENIAFGIKSEDIDEEKAWKALEQAQLKEFVQTLPDGLYTQIGERGVRLSGGQRQRIGIARALYGNPEILVLDEATSALDNETETAVMEAIQGLKGSKTVIIVAHRLSTIEHCDVIYKVEKGAVVNG